MPSNYTLGARVEVFVKELLASGRYNNASEVVHERLGLPGKREKLREIKVAELRRLAERGRLSGLSEDEGEAVLDRLEAKYRAMAADGPGRRGDFASAAEPKPISKRSPPTSHATTLHALSPLCASCANMLPAGGVS